MSRLKVVLPVAGKPPKTISTRPTMPDGPGVFEAMSNTSAAGVGKLRAVGDPVVLPVVQPSLGEVDFGGGVGTTPRLAEDLRGIRSVRVEHGEQPTELVEA